MRLTKQQIEYQKAILDEFDLSEQFSVGKDLVRHMAHEIQLCHEQISKKNSLLDELGHELQETALALEAERNLSRLEHLKRAIWIRHF